MQRAYNGDVDMVRTKYVLTEICVALVTCAVEAMQCCQDDGVVVCDECAHNQCDQTSCPS